MPARSGNAAPFYERLRLLLRTKPLSGDAGFAGTSGQGIAYLPDRAAQICRGVAGRPDVTRLVNAAAARPFCVYDLERTGPLDVLFQESDAERAATRWLCAESAAALFSNRPLEAVRIQARGFRCADHCLPRGMIGAMSATDCASVVFCGLKRALYRSGDEPAVCRAVQSAVEREMPHVDFSNSLAFETFFFIVSARAIQGEGSDGVRAAWDRMPKGRLPADPNAQMAVWERSEAILIHGLRRCVHAAGQPAPVMLRSLRIISGEYTAKRTEPGYVFAAHYIPALESSVERVVESEAMRPVLAASAAVLTWRDEHGSFPETLARAMPHVPSDPFDGKPIRYRVLGNHFVVFSVGRTGRFDGGTAFARPGWSEAVFRYPMPAYDAPQSAAPVRSASLIHAKPR